MMGGGPSRGNADSDDVRKNVRNGSILAADGEIVSRGAKKIGPMSRETFSFGSQDRITSPLEPMFSLQDIVIYAASKGFEANPRRSKRGDIREGLRR